MIVDKFFRLNSKDRVSPFDEGPRPPPTKTSSSDLGSINTTQIDPWRQGVEITDIKHWDAGIVKIHAGEPGHRLPEKHIGYGKSFRYEQNYWEEIELFNPVKFIQEQIKGTLTWPVVVRDYNSSDSNGLDGVIEPLSIRPVASFFSIDLPEPRAFRGALMDGNIDIHGASSRITSVDYFDPTSDFVGYVDCVDTLGGVPLGGYFQNVQAKIEPFVDQRLPRDVSLSTNHSIELSAALYATYSSGSQNFVYKSTDTHVRYNQISATSGFVFDAVQGVGTDSLAFGGLTY